MASSARSTSPRRQAVAGRSTRFINFMTSNYDLFLQKAMSAVLEKVHTGCPASSLMLTLHEGERRYPIHVTQALLEHVRKCATRGVTRVPPGLSAEAFQDDYESFITSVTQDTLKDVWTNHTQPAIKAADLKHIAQDLTHEDITFSVNSLLPKMESICTEFDPLQVLSSRRANAAYNVLTSNPQIIDDAINILDSTTFIKVDQSTHPVSIVPSLDIYSMVRRLKVSKKKGTDELEDKVSNVEIISQIFELYENNLDHYKNLENNFFNRALRSIISTYRIIDVNLYFKLIMVAAQHYTLLSAHSFTQPGYSINLPGFIGDKGNCWILPSVAAPNFAAKARAMTNQSTIRVVDSADGSASLLYINAKYSDLKNSIYTMFRKVVAAMHVGVDKKELESRAIEQHILKYADGTGPGIIRDRLYPKEQGGYQDSWAITKGDFFKLSAIGVSLAMSSLEGLSVGLSTFGYNIVGEIANILMERGDTMLRNLLKEHIGKAATTDKIAILETADGAVYAEPGPNPRSRAKKSALFSQTAVSIRAASVPVISGMIASSAASLRAPSVAPSLRHRTNVPRWTAGSNRGVSEVLSMRSSAPSQV